jgi:hypothetical protein
LRGRHSRLHPSTQFLVVLRGRHSCRYVSPHIIKDFRGVYVRRLLLFVTSFLRVSFVCLFICLSLYLSIRFYTPQIVLVSELALFGCDIVTTNLVYCLRSLSVLLCPSMPVIYAFFRTLCMADISVWQMVDVYLMPMYM